MFARAGHRISDTYTLGERLGGGNSGEVFACRNSVTGETAAAKRISVRAQTTRLRDEVRREVELLRRLDHPNIVKYIDTVSTRDHLYIILELMENGSLAKNIKIFGPLSQPLCALYVRQILSGLMYLHEQGTIHRDIKGPNILTTKSGLVKLADFGVAQTRPPVASATAQSGPGEGGAEGEEAGEVVGTPYWMAPEIIELRPATSACDIWSLGCTIIELLTLDPPYADVPTAPAMFKIVQDEHPPLPEGISEALRDFLLLCFQKDPSVRSSASYLIQHPWVRHSGAAEDDVAVSASAAAAALHQAAAAAGESADSSGSRASAAQESEWKKSMRNTARLSRQQIRDEQREQQERADATSRQQQERAGAAQGAGDDDDDEEEDEEEDWNEWDAPQAKPKARGGQQAPLQDRETRIGEQMRALTGSRSDASLPGAHAPLTARFAAPLDAAELAAAFGDDDDEDDDHDARAATRAGASATAAAAAAAPAPPRASGGGGGGGGATDAVQRRLDMYREAEADDGGLPDVIRWNSQASSAAEDTASTADVLERVRTGMQAARHEQQRRRRQGELPEEDPFAEADDEDFEEDAGRGALAQQLQHAERLLDKMRLEGDDGAAAAQTGARLSALLREQPGLRGALLRHRGVIPVMEALAAAGPAALPAVMRVVGQLIEGDRSAQELLCVAGVVPALARLAAPGQASREARLEAASIAGQLLRTSAVTLQMFVACGGLPVLASLLASAPASSGSGDALADALAEARAPPPDVQLARVGVEGVRRVFALSARDGGARGGIPRTDFCRLLAKEGLPRRLVALLQHCRTPRGAQECADAGVEAPALATEAASLLLVFSEADSVVKQQMADVVSLEGLLRVLVLEAPAETGRRARRARRQTQQAAQQATQQSRSGDAVLSEAEALPLVKTLLKCVKNLSMDPASRDALEAAGAVPALVPILEYCSAVGELGRQQHRLNKQQRDRKGVRRRAGKGGEAEGAPGTALMPGQPLTAPEEQLVKEVQNLVMLSLFYLCRLSRARQEQAAVSGIIPFLMDAVATRSAAKTFALQILTDLAHTSDLTRDQLWRWDALDFYLDLLVSGDVFWQERALVSLGAWLAHARPEVERAVLRPRSLQRLVALFQAAQGAAFQGLVKELLAMLGSSARLAEALGRSGLFLAELVARLSFPKAEVRIILLKTLRLVGDAHQDLEYLVLEHNLMAVVLKVAREAENANHVLVAETANTLAADWRATLLEQGDL